MEIETRIENKNKEQRKNKLGSMSFIKCVPKAKKNKRKFMLFHPQMGPKNKTSFGLKGESDMPKEESDSSLAFERIVIVWKKFWFCDGLQYSCCRC